MLRIECTDEDMERRANEAFAKDLAAGSDGTPEGEAIYFIQRFIDAFCRPGEAVSEAQIIWLVRELPILLTTGKPPQ